MAKNCNFTIMTYVNQLDHYKVPVDSLTESERRRNGDAGNKLFVICFSQSMVLCSHVVTVLATVLLYLSISFFSGLAVG